ncbi:MAG: NAD(P)H-dependent oxidoreductase subunit E [Chloroflexota bacterium]|nr:NAD(P)H-dependent oxidoreductase subunit E [Chloroflexota bacterium]
MKRYPKEVEQILSKYPPEGRRSAVMPLLFLAQREEGYVNQASMKDIAKILDITETDVASIVRFYTLYHDKKEGRYRMQVCTDLPCALRGAEEFLEAVCDRLGLNVGETTADGFLTLEAVTCLAACDKAPMFQIQGPDGLKYHENMNVDKTVDVISTLKRKS